MRIENLQGFIDFPSGFKLLSSTPIDCRFFGEDLTFLDSILEADAAYPGLKVYIKSTKKFYTFSLENGSYSYSEDSSQLSLTEEQQAALDSGITASKLGELENKYRKPDTGIPESDLDQGLKAKLDRTAITSMSAGSIRGEILFTDTQGNSRTFKIPQIEDFTTEEEVIRIISNRSSRQITRNSSGDSFNNLDELTSGPWYYGGQAIYQFIEGDKAFILASESNTAKTMAYDGHSWVLVSTGEYSFSQSERSALDSGITSEKVDQINTNTTDIEGEKTRARENEDRLALKIADDIISHNSSNGSHSDIRESLTTLEGSIGEVDSKVSQLEGVPSRLSNVEGQITGLNSAIGETENKIATAKSQLTEQFNTQLNSLSNSKQPSLESGGPGNSNLLLQPESVGGKPRTISKATLISEIEDSKITPIAERVTAIETKNSEQDTAISQAQSAAEAAQSTADSKVGSIAEGTTNGTINVDGTDVPVKGLKNLAYKDSLTKAEVGLGNITNDQQATKAEFNALKTKVERLEALGSFVGSYNTYGDLPDNISSIQDKYGVDATVNDFATVRSGPYTDGPNSLASDDVTCWSITSISGNGDISWAWEYTLDKDITGKIDKVVNSTEGRIAILTSDGEIGEYDKTAAEIDTAISTAQSTADSALSGLESKVGKIEGKQLSTNDYTSEDKAEVAKIKDSVRGITAGGGLGKINYTTNGDEKGDFTEVDLGLGNMAGKTLGDGEGIVKQTPSGGLEVYSPYFCTIGAKEGEIPPGFDKHHKFNWSPTVINNEYKAEFLPNSDLTASSEGNPIISYGNIGIKNFGNSGNLYFPKMRIFRIISSTSLEELTGLSELNPTTGLMTIRLPHPLSLLIIIE